MKLSKEHITSFALGVCVFYLLTHTACSSSKLDINSVRDSKGWIDNNTYAIIAVGRPVRTHANARQLKNSARRAAVMNARFKILKRFKALNRRKSSKGDPPRTRLKQTIMIRDIIKNGKVVYEKFDQRHNCEIIYQIRHKELKRLIENVDLSTIDVIN